MTKRTITGIIIDMCGIAGIISFNSNDVRKKDLEIMGERLAHRGLDDSGIWVSENQKVGFAHRRLSIIDLSKNGRQPMGYLNKYTIVYNGEVYNFQEERENLQKRGYKFHSNTDTEVLLALYDKYGIKMLDHLRGMFAFAIFDKLRNIVFLARDRLGVKPLKYFLNNDQIIFASELKSILTHPNVRRSVDYKAIYMYLTYGYVPSPLSGFENIYKLEPGHYMVIDLNKKAINKHRYWEPLYKDKLQLSEKEWCSEILKVLEEATKIRMISDVPLGAMLSGGVDSSAVVAMMAINSKRPIKTYTISFKNKNYSEDEFARSISKLYRTEYHQLEVDPNCIEILPQIAQIFEEPFANSSNVITYLVSKLAKQHISVALNGDGGDENFAGYPNRYLRLKRDVDLNFWISKLGPLALSALRPLSKMAHISAFDKSVRFLEKSKLPLYRRFISYNHIFGIEEIQNLTTEELNKNDYSDEIFKPVKKCFDSFEGSDKKDAGLKFDILYYLADELLPKVDLSSMAVSLETRSPFLDYKLVELACKIPFNLKVKNGESKYILKKSLEKIVPYKNLYRRKMGFSIPLFDWFNTDLMPYTSSLLLSKKSSIRNLVKVEEIQKMIRLHGKEQDYGARLWSLLSLELWFKYYFF